MITKANILTSIILCYEKHVLIGDNRYSSIF